MKCKCQRSADLAGGADSSSDRLLPQLLALGSRDFLREFAQQLFADRAIPPSPEKTTAVSKLVQAVITKTTFYEPGGARDQSTGAKDCIRLCANLGCSPLISSVIDHARNVSDLASHDVLECARAVMLPLVAWCAELRRTNPGIIPDPGFDKLRRTGLKLYLRWLEVNAAKVERAHVATLVQAAVVDEDPTAFMCR